MTKSTKSPDESGVSEEKKKYVRRTPRTKTAEVKSPDESGVSKAAEVLTIQSDCPNTLIDPNNNRAFPAFTVVKDVVKTNWIEVQIEARLLKEV